MTLLLDHLRTGAWAHLLGAALVISPFAYVGDWFMVVTLVAMTALYEVYDSRKVPHDVACAKCRHRKDQHHGNCQECLREDVRGDLDLAVPCSQFGRVVARR